MRKHRDRKIGIFGSEIMKKDRFVAFFDAVMAIIMTIVVLEFAIPKGTNWSDMKELGTQVVVYALSFFWLGMMWININTIWHQVEVIDRKVMWVNMFMLFFSSMIPFLVVFVGANLTERIPQLLYGVDVVCITICNQLSAELLKKLNPVLLPIVTNLRLGIGIDLAIKTVGIILGMLIWPPITIISVFVAMICLVVEFSIANRKHNLKSEGKDV